jgi:hypothetical protein
MTITNFNLLRTYAKTVHSLHDAKVILNNTQNKLFRKNYAFYGEISRNHKEITQDKRKIMKQGQDDDLRDRMTGEGHTASHRE